MVVAKFWEIEKKRQEREREREPGSLEIASHHSCHISLAKARPPGNIQKFEGLDSTS